MKLKTDADSWNINLIPRSTHINHEGTRCHDTDKTISHDGIYSRLQ